MFRRRGFVELGAFVVLTIGLTFAAYGVFSLLEPLSPPVRSFLRNPASPWPIFVASVFIAMAVVKVWSRRHPDPPSDRHSRR